MYQARCSYWLAEVMPVVEQGLGHFVRRKQHLLLSVNYACAFCAMTSYMCNVQSFRTLDLYASHAAGPTRLKTIKILEEGKAKSTIHFRKLFD